MINRVLLSRLGTRCPLLAWVTLYVRPILIPPALIAGIQVGQIRYQLIDVVATKKGPAPPPSRINLPEGEAGSSAYTGNRFIQTV